MSPPMKIFNIDINPIKKTNNAFIECKHIQNINNDNKNVFITIFQMLKENKSTISKRNVKINEIIANTSTNFANVVNSQLNDSFYDSNSNNENTFSFLNVSSSTIYSSKSHIDISSIFSEKIKEKNFNPARTNYYMKNKLYDISLSKDINDFHYPPKYIINEKFFAFVYPNEIMTFCIAISGFIYTDKINEDKDSYNCVFGLFFCGKNVVVKNGNETETKKCLPHEFTCQECMKKNKDKYNIKNKYLININGRVSKINKGKYHCFGHFLCGNVIEDCITKFQCKACQQLASYSYYYLEN